MPPDTGARDAHRTRADFARRLTSCLDIAASALPLLACAPYKRGVTPRYQREKFICETALLLYAADGAAYDSPQLRERIHALASALAPHARSETVLMTMHLRPALAPELSVAHNCLTRIGYPDPAFQGELEHALGASAVGMLERAPWKQLEHAWGAGIGNPPLTMDPGCAPAKSMLGTGLDAFAAEREDLYAFTHALIYLTDFGLAPRTPPRAAALLVADADVALARCLDDDDFDLAAELLLTWPYLRATWTPTATFALAVLTDVEDEVGLLPSLTLSAERFAELADAERRLYVLREAYHTVYVMGFLASALLLPGCTPPAGIEAARDVGAARTVLSLLPACTPMPLWEARLARLPETQQDSLAPFLAAVGVRRAITQSDFGRLRDILTASIEEGLPITPAIRQGVELLSRLGSRETRRAARLAA